MEENEKPSKEPWLAVVLSFFGAGIGQIYAGKFVRGGILVLIGLTLNCVGIWSLLDAACDLIVTAVIGLVGFAVWFWNLFDAHKCARKANPDWFEADRKLSKDPWLSLFLSDRIPGIGHFYIRKWVWGIILIIIAVHLFVARIMYPPVCVVIWAVFSAFVCFHSYMMTPLRREKSKSVVVTVSVVILCLHLLGPYCSYFFKTYVVDVFQIPNYEELSYFSPADNMLGGSMMPTLKPGDRFLVRKNRKYIPKLGDVVLFKPPNDTDYPYIKRVAALPHETVEIKGGILYVDGQEIRQLDFEAKMYPPYNFGVEQPYKVPDGCVFLIGDNSANSWDSRSFGAIQQSDIIGTPYKIYWPLSRRGPIN